MRLRTITAAACCLVAAACSERPTQPLTPPSFQVVPSVSCPTSDAVNHLIGEVVPVGSFRSSVFSRFSIIVRLVTQSGPDTATARASALELTQMLVNQYRAGQLIGGQSAGTQATLIQVLNGILCWVGLPQVFGPGSLGNGGAAAFIFPTTPDTDVVTGDLLAGVHVPGGSVTEPTIVTVQPLPNSPGPLLTPLDQYPLFYQYNKTSSSDFTQGVTVGVCLASNVAPPDPSRLRLAHNIAPYSGISIEILPLAPAPFIDCTNAPSASLTGKWGFDLASATGAILRNGLESLVLPQTLSATPFYFAAGGVGGTVKEFSPFGAVDTLGMMVANSSTEFHGSVNHSADGKPSVLLTTPTGRPMAGVPVNFAITSGGTSIAGASTTTNSSGVATSGIWTLGPIKACSIAFGTATMTPGSGLTGNPVKFFGCAR